MKLALISFVSMYVLWVLYLAVMNLKRARDAGTITRAAYVLGSPLLYGGLLLDVLVNLTIYTILLLELPQEWTVSARTKRHYYESEGFRHAIAAWIADNLLNAFDPSGRHV